jgi:hypothetical protein
MNMGKLEGKTALIIGGSSGIGLATAKRFVDERCRVGGCRHAADHAGAQAKTQLRQDEDAKNGATGGKKWLFRWRRYASQSGALSVHFRLQMRYFSANECMLNCRKPMNGWWVQTEQDELTNCLLLLHAAPMIGGFYRGSTNGLKTSYFWLHNSCIIAPEQRLLARQWANSSERNLLIPNNSVWNREFGKPPTQRRCVL